MQDLPDDPRIRDAELNGYPSADPVNCPVCGDEANSFYLQENTRQEKSVFTTFTKKK